MAQSTNTSYAVIAVGDRETIARFDLTERAALQGAVVSETYCFEPGEAAAQDDLTDVEAAVTALGRAIATRTDIWVPFPMDDFGREQHVRRLSLVLQRHGLNMLMGHDLEPCTMDGGFSAIDYALRMEVKAVDELGFAALASAGVRTLGIEMEVELTMGADAVAGPAVQPPAPRPTASRPAAPEPQRPAEKLYGTSDVVRFFGKPLQWLLRAMRTGVFTRPDGSPIEPIRVGKNGRRRFTLPMLRDMAHAGYRAGLIDEDELLDLLAVLARAEEE